MYLGGRHGGISSGSGSGSVELGIVNTISIALSPRSTTS